MNMNKFIITLIVLFSYTNANADINLDIEQCAKANINACVDVADSYEERGDHSSALSYYQKSCDLNSGYGCRWAGIYLDPHFSEYKVNKNKKLSISTYIKSCKLSDATSCNNIGVDYRDGNGVNKNLALAKKYFQQSCVEIEDGEGEGCYNLGYIYDNGKGAKTNKPQAVKFYNIGCELLEHSESCYALGHIYYYGGEGVTKNHKKSKIYFSRSCEYGLDDGCLAMKDPF